MCERVLPAGRVRSREHQWAKRTLIDAEPDAPAPLTAVAVMVCQPPYWEAVQSSDAVDTVHTVSPSTARPSDEMPVGSPALTENV
jgi:hypothetical protein